MLEGVSPPAFNMSWYSSFGLVLRSPLLTYLGVHKEYPACHLLCVGQAESPRLEDVTCQKVTYLEAKWHAGFLN